MAKEKSITDKVLAYLNSVEGCIAEKQFGGSLQKDRPDINGCCRGRSFRIEMKSPDHGYKTSLGQRLNLKQWARAGSLCFSSDNLADIKLRINNERCE